VGKPHKEYNETDNCVLARQRKNEKDVLCNHQNFDITNGSHRLFHSVIVEILKKYQCWLKERSNGKSAPK